MFLLFLLLPFFPVFAFILFVVGPSLSSPPRSDLYIVVCHSPQHISDIFLNDDCGRNIETGVEKRPIFYARFFRDRKKNALGEDVNQLCPVDRHSNIHSLLIRSNSHSLAR